MDRFFSSSNASAAVRLSVVAFALFAIVGFSGLAYAVEPGEPEDVSLSSDSVSVVDQASEGVAEVPSATTAPSPQDDTQDVADDNQQTLELPVEDVPEVESSDAEEELSDSGTLVDDEIEGNTSSQEEQSVVEDEAPAEGCSQSPTPTNEGNAELEDAAEGGEDIEDAADDGGGEIVSQPTSEEATVQMASSAGVVVAIADQNTVSATQKKTNVMAKDSDKDEVAKSLAARSGVLSTGLRWSLSSKGVLTVSGNGKIPDSSLRSGSLPWNSNSSIRLAIKKIVISNGVTYIGKYAFHDCKNAKSISLPNTLKQIGCEAFSCCESLRAITIPDSVDEVGFGAFAECGDLTDATINAAYLDGMRNRGVFYSCSSLKNVRVNSSYLGYATFWGCAGLSSVTLSDRLTFIGSRAFNMCRSLKSVYIPNGVTHIGDEAFYACTSLSVVSLSTTVSSIGEAAFGYMAYGSVIYAPTNSQYNKLNRNSMYISPERTRVIHQGHIGSAQISLAHTSYTYNGKAKKPGVTVKFGSRALVLGRDFKLKYSNNTKAGRGQVTIVGIGEYVGSVGRAFTIRPQAPKVTSVKTGSNGVVVRWGKAGGATGYKVYRKAGSGKWMLVKTTKYTNWTDSSTKKNGRTYRYMVVPFAKSGKTLVNGKASNAKALVFKVTKRPSVNYSTHVQNVGWQGAKKNGQVSGTSGKALRLEAITIKLTDKGYAGLSGGITYRTHVQNVGWQGWKKDGQASGTSGKALRLEAIQIKLTGDIAKYYDVVYRVHSQNFGWMGWAKNGAKAGTAGYAYRLEAIQIKLVKKGTKVSSGSRAFRQR